MREISVKYLLSDKDEKRLTKITEKYNKSAKVKTTEESLFEVIMIMGADYDKEHKFNNYEKLLSMR